MVYNLEKYWKKIYEKRINKDYKSQSLQSQEIIEWHEKYIKNYLQKEFKKYKPKVLDIGCCSGYLTNLFIKFSPKVVGIDYENGFIKIAKQKYLGPKFIKGNIYNLNKINGKFDLIVCFGVLQNISDLKLALKNIKSKLGNSVKSKVVFTTINHQSILKKNKKYILNLFSENQLNLFSKQCGLKMIRYEYMYVMPKILSPLSFIIKLLFPSSFSHHVLIEMKHD